MSIILTVTAVAYQAYRRNTSLSNDIKERAPVDILANLRYYTQQNVWTVWVCASVGADSWPPNPYSTEIKVNPLSCLVLCPLKFALVSYFVIDLIGQYIQYKVYTFKDGQSSTGWHCLKILLITFYYRNVYFSFAYLTRNTSNFKSHAKNNHCFHIIGVVSYYCKQ